MDEAEAVRERLTWFLQTEDENALRSGLTAIAPALWPGFSAEAAAELQSEAHANRERHRRLLGEERRRREY